MNGGERGSAKHEAVGLRGMEICCSIASLSWWRLCELFMNGGEREGIDGGKRIK